MKTILIGITVISILALTSMAYAGHYNRGNGYAVYAGFYGPPVFNVIVGNGHERFGFVLNGYGGYYGYRNPYYGYGYSKPYYGNYKRYKYMRPYRNGYRNGSKFYGRGYKRYPRQRAYWR